MSTNPHLGIPVQSFGPAPDTVGLVAVLIHGRTQSSSDMLAVASRLNLAGMPCIVLNAADNSWYPNQFMEPVANNQPRLDFALERLDQLLSDLNERGIPNEHIAIVGFSQGACLACEYVFRKKQPFAALVAYTGGLIGPEGTQWERTGRLKGMPIFLSNGDQDPWVPLDRTRQTLEVFNAMGAQAELKVYPGRSHEVSDDEIMTSRTLLQSAMRLATKQPSSTQSPDRTPWP